MKCSSNSERGHYFESWSSNYIFDSCSTGASPPLRYLIRHIEARARDSPIACESRDIFLERVYRFALQKEIVGREGHDSGLDNDDRRRNKRLSETLFVHCKLADIASLRPLTAEVAVPKDIELSSLA